MKRMAISVILLVLLVALFQGCGAGGKKAEESGDEGVLVEETAGNEAARTTGRTFTLEELAEYDGRDGKPAYVAVDGLVYDVTASQRWQGGHHQVCPLDPRAGQDLSEEIRQAPAWMRDRLQEFPVVGTLAP